MSLDLKAEYNELLEIKKMMFLLKGEIAYGSCTINEALANISTRCGMNTVSYTHLTLPTIA